MAGKDKMTEEEFKKGIAEYQARNADPETLDIAKDSVSGKLFDYIKELFQTPKYKCPFCGGIMDSLGHTVVDPTIPITPISSTNPGLYYICCTECKAEYPYYDLFPCPEVIPTASKVWFDPYIAWYDLCNDPVRFNKWVVQCVLSREENKALKRRYWELVQDKAYKELERNYYESWGMAHSASRINRAREEFKLAKEAFDKVFEEVNKICQPYFKKVEEFTNDGTGKDN